MEWPWHEQHLEHKEQGVTSTWVIHHGHGVCRDVIARVQCSEAKSGEQII